jgi:DNA-binding SARP family transcriptional activator
VARLSLSLLGPFYTTLDGVAVTDFRYDHVRALLAYLAVEADRPHRRESLSGLLWPDQPDPTALESLRHALYHLQRTIGSQKATPPFLLISRDTLQFNARSDYALDVSLFESLVSAQESTAGRLQRLEQAVGTYRGPFLQGFSLGSSDALEEWQLQKRAQLDRLMGEALDELAQAFEARREYERAEDYARRLLALDPWDEPMHRRLMRALALQGRRGAALAQYASIRELLQTEFGVEPEPETIALYGRIRAGQLRSPAGEPRLAAAPRPAAPVSARFVGRDAELQQLSDRLNEALAGQGRVACVTGEAGCGKSMLIAEFARRAMASHPQLVVACGTCTAQNGTGDPYLPFREILQSLCGDVSTPLTDGTIPRVYADRQWAIAPLVIQALVETGRDLIDRLVPARPLGLRAESLPHQMPNGIKRASWLRQLQKLVERPRPIYGPGALVTQADLFTQYTHVLQSAARAGPLLLILDDLQWADAGTIGLLFHLGRRLAGQRILILGAYRPEQVAMGRDGQRHPLEEVANEFRGAGEDCVNLEQAEGRAFITALLDWEPNRLDARFRETLYQHTQGHALYTVELLQSLQDRGELRRDSDGRWVESPGLNWKALPPRVEATIAERLARLPEAQRAILDVASVEGELFTAEVVAWVRGMEEQQVSACLSRELGARLRFVRAEEMTWQGSQSLSRYRFRHQLFQQYLYDSLDAVERARLHGAVLAALEALHGSRTEALAGALARHAEAAGLGERAAHYWLRAGQRAVAMSAYDEAVALLQRSLASLSALPDSGERDRCELEAQLALASPLYVVQGWSAPLRLAAAERAYRLATQLRDAEHRLPLLALLAHLELGRLQPRRALGLSEQLLSLAQASGSALYAAAGHDLSGMSLLMQGKLRRARAHLEQGLVGYPWEADRGTAVIVGAMGTDLQVDLYLWLSYCCWLLGYPDQANEHGLEMLRLAERLGHPFTLAMALALRCLVMSCTRTEIGGVLAHSEHLLRLADEKGLPFMRPWGMVLCGWTRAVTGQGADAIRQLSAGLEALLQTGTLASAPILRALLAGAYLHVGQAGKGLAVVDSMLREGEEHGAIHNKADLLRLKGELLLANQPDATDAAATCFLQGLELARQQEARAFELRAALSLARLWQGQSRSDEAREMLAGIYGWFTEGFDTPDLQEARAALEQMARSGQRKVDLRS